MLYSILALAYLWVKAGVGLTDTQQILLPYKITLLSNRCADINIARAVLLPYKITLLSNLKFEKATLLAV